MLYAIADEWAATLGDAINTRHARPAGVDSLPRPGEMLRRLHDAGVAVGIVSNTGWDVRAVFAAHCDVGLRHLVHLVLRGRCGEAGRQDIRGGMHVVGPRRPDRS